MSDTPVIHWFRRDLRLNDNTALAAAFATGKPVLPVFILDSTILEGPRYGGLPIVFMLRILKGLDARLQEHGSRLLIRHGKPTEILPQLVTEFAAQAVYFNQDYTPYARRRDAQIHEALTIEVYDFEDVALVAPGLVLKADGDPYTVYTPFMKKWKEFPKPDQWTDSGGRFFPVSAEQTGTLPVSAWHDIWPEPTEAVAQEQLAQFTAQAIFRYGRSRNNLTINPFANGASLDTSCLSPYLRFGVLSPRQAYWAARSAHRQAPGAEAEKSVETWVNELIWREFYMHIMYHFPHVMKRNFREKYDALQWRNAPDELEAWKNGQTGVPVIDAAMRQLKAIGWMPNRARMLVASFLTKHLLIDWHEGERHFMRWLIDGDPAANNGGWQWAAGTGTDAQPYFRIFNPVTQAAKHDPDGAYVRHWVPELQSVSSKFVHEPWQMATPPTAYPPPIIDLAAGRERALAAFKQIEPEKS